MSILLRCCKDEASQKQAQLNIKDNGESLLDNETHESLQTFKYCV